MNWNLLTYKEAKAITEEATDALFYEAVADVDGYKVCMFNYRLANYTDFVKYGADEMRGLTFIFNKDGSLFSRDLMLHKFWNLNQVTETFYENVKDIKISNVMSKEDGSLISFSKLPNGKVVARSKMSYQSDQAIAANEIYNTNSEVNRIVNWGFDHNIALFFEYVSRSNKIVLDYDKDDLILLRARNNSDGNYLDIRGFDYGGTKAKFFDYTLDELIELAKTEENSEGWIIESDKGLMKMKTEWYYVRHKLFTEELNRTNDVIRLILDAEIDDVLAQLTDAESDMAKRGWIGDIETTLSNYITKTTTEFDELFSLYNGDIKVFAINNRTNPLFGMAVNVINGKANKYDSIVKKILKDTSHLKQAEKWIEVNS